MTQMFECPSCGASLEYRGDDDPVVRCSYCGSMVIVPEDLRPKSSQPQPAMPTTGSALTIDLRGLSGNLAKLKAIKQLVRDGQVPEAVKVYQQTLGADAQEAQEVVGRLSRGESVVIHGTAFETSLPVVSGEQAQVVSGEQLAQVLEQQLGSARQWQRKIGRFVTCVFVLMLLAMLACLVLSVAGSSLLESAF